MCVPVAVVAVGVVAGDGAAEGFSGFSEEASCGFCVDGYAFDLVFEQYFACFLDLIGVVVE